MLIKIMKDSKMKQSAKFIGCLVILLCLAVPVWAKGVSDVAETVHNMSLVT